MKFWVFFAHNIIGCLAAVSSYNYVPLGSNPTLYTPGFEPIMHLDQQTFADTVYQQDKAFIVEFYADWCGHCRAFAPFFRQFASLVTEWRSVVDVAVINCADSFNANVCKDNGISYFPMLKYFPRNARSPTDAKNMETPHSPEQMRESLVRMISNEYAVYRYPDWPAFNHINVDSRTTYGQLWQGIPDSADYMAILFETYASCFSLITRSNVKSFRFSTNMKFWVFFAHNIIGCLAAVSSYNYVPLGSNPTLYTPGFEPIMHLDQQTFADTVYQQDKAFIVEFYADWCGHCRAFAPFFRQFASLVTEWRSVVDVAVINCADSFNANVCKDNGISYFPMLKYFPRNARSPTDAKNMETPHSPEQMRESLVRMISNEYAVYRYPDWPAFNHINVDSRTTYGQLWQGIPDSADYMAILFETYDGIGAQFVLDASSRSAVMGSRRALSTSPLVQMLRIREFPTVALFRRDHQQALFMAKFGNGTFSELDGIIMQDAKASFSNIPQLFTTTQRPIVTTTQTAIIDCQANPERCADMYYVSETDMLKAMRMALYDEVIRSPGYIQGENFTALTDFVTLLSNHFPVLSFQSDLRNRRTKRTTSTILKSSERARLIFSHMREYLEARNSQRIVSVDDYKRQFENVERVYANPFPVNSTWQHCRGSSPMFRGYTCGLWTTFHALTVHTYIDTIKDDQVDALKPLKNIQGWVKGFFGCQHCKNHFMHMTTTLFPLNERRVRHPHDMMTYLWRAHNIVNNRLHGDATEDPQYQKMQFPAPFLCPTCHSGGQFSRRQVRNFLLRYYGSIKPHNRLQNRRLAFF